ncbi:MAG: hypothetical protein WBA57_05360 [Elainellaceae cyanobacterium]
MRSGQAEGRGAAVYALSLRLLLQPALTVTLTIALTVTLTIENSANPDLTFNLHENEKGSDESLP